MKTILTFSMILMMISTSLFSQARIGKTLKEIQTEYKTHNIEYSYTDSGCVELVILDFDSVLVMHHISKYETVLSTAILPKNFGVLVQMKHRYDSLYQKKSEDIWKGPNDSEIILIEGTESKQLMFIWYDLINPIENKI